MTRGPQKSFDREDVLGRAMDLFWKQGYEATGMAQLLEHMGIGRQSLYDTFGDKKSLFLNALEHYFKQRIKAAGELLQKPGSPLENLKCLAEAMVYQRAGDEQWGCFIGNTLAEFGHRDPDVKKVVSRFLDRVRAVLKDTLERAQDAGELASDAPIEELAEFLNAAAQGLALLSKVEPERSRIDGILRTSFAMLDKAQP